MPQESAHYRGALYTHRSGVNRAAIDSIAAIGSHLTISSSSVRGWKSIVLRSRTPLLNEDTFGAHQGTYDYSYLYRQGQDNHFLLVAVDPSKQNKLNRHILDSAGLFSQVTSPAVNVPRLVDSLTNRPTVYVMSSVHAKVEGYGESLRNIGFYGDDIGEAMLFRDIVPKLIPSVVQLRDTIKKREIMSVGIDGSVRFPYFGPYTLSDVDAALRFLSQNDFLRWQVEEV